MPIILTYPFFLFALAVLPATVILYMLYMRRKKHTVSCLFLWERISMPREKGRRLNRMIFPLLLFIELIILSLLILTAAEPQLLMQNRFRPLVVILDNSVSMQATTGDKSSQERAAEYLQQLLLREKFTSIRFIIAGTEYRVRPVFRTHEEAWRDAQSAWTCNETADSCDAAYRHAGELAGKDKRVLILTDHAYKDGNVLDGARWHSVGRPVDNTAFISARRTAADAGDRCFLEVSNFSDKEKETQVEIYAGGVKTGMVHTLALNPWDSRRLIFTVPENTGALHVHLPEDALKADNHVILLPAPRKNVRVTNAVSDVATHEIIDAAVRSSGMTTKGEDAPIVLFNDTFLSATDAEKLAEREIYAGIVACVRPKKAVLYAGPFFVDTLHPLTEGVHLENVVWGASEDILLPGIPLVTADNTPLLSVIDFTEECEQIGIQFAPESTTLHMTPNWPVLIWNILHRVAQHAPGPESTTVYAGMTVAVMSPAEYIECRYPDGNKARRKSVNNRVDFSFNTPGLHTFTDGRREWRVVANMCVAKESNLQMAKQSTQDTWYSLELIKKEYYSLSTWIISGALAVLILHTYLVRRAGGLQ